MLTDTSIIEESVRIQGRTRSLEGLLTYPGGEAQCSVLVAGPHPFLGGDMGNNVVHELAKHLASRGAVTLTFNYGGVGTSEGGPNDWPAVMSAFWNDGTFAEEHDWSVDAGSAITALHEWSDAPTVLIGYSFGCWAVVDQIAAAKPNAVVLISPNPKHHAFEALACCTAPLLLIHSDHDFTLDSSEMIAWFESLREPKTRLQIASGEHFFRGHEGEVSDAVSRFLQHHDLLSNT